MSRIGKFVAWFITFGLSFLAAEWGWAEQGKAFFFTSLSMDVVVLLILLVLMITASIADGEVSVTGIVAIIFLICEVALVVFATWGATKLFNVDFYVAYQLMTFGQCLCITKKKDD